MSEQAADGDRLTRAVLIALAGESAAAGAARLQAAGLWDGATAAALAEAALDEAEVNVAAAAAWLRLAELIAVAMGDEAGLRGQIAYAWARVAVHQGDLAMAETWLRRCQDAWNAAGDAARLARSRLGMTQILAMQGRYAEAQEAVTAALAWLEQAGDDAETLMLLARGQRNLATLLVYQDRHAAALAAYGAAQATLARLAAVLPEAARATLAPELGHVALNAASAYTFLDQPARAETELLAAIDYFTQAAERVNRGRATANLARLYTRVGDYAAALARFEQAAQDLVGDAVADADESAAAQRLADELLLEQGLAYVALNLLPEAARTLTTCEQLFRAAGQPYELAQTRYTQGLLAARREDWAAARDALREAHAGFESLGNRYWVNRSAVALAHLAGLQEDAAAARAHLGDLPAAVVADAASGALVWDAPTLTEAWLLRLRLDLAAGDLAAARTAAARVAAILAAAGTRLPHLALRLLHGRGLLARAGGDARAARAFFAAAADLLEAQRAALPVDELRSAFLDDKMAVYADWVLALLEMPLAGEDEVAAAFAVVERARSRALLERLLAALGTEPAPPPARERVPAEDAEVAARRAALREELGRLYNRLLSDTESRHMTVELSLELARREAALQALEWRMTAVPALSLPVTLSDLQAHLRDDQQALVYFIAGDEVMAFVVARQEAQVVRRLCHRRELADAQAELRFQLGRMEMDAAYVTRRMAHLLRGAQTALGLFYRLLWQRVAPLLWAEECLIMPYGPLHLTPFHALWDGERYVIERHRIVYAPSAAVWVHAARAGRTQRPVFSRFAGFAPIDARIPAAVGEVLAAARHFAAAQPYIGEQATLAALRVAAQTVDVLHLATHGLFRTDNAFFSALKLADGWLDVRAIHHLPKMARLVVLSACESGAGAVRGGDEVIGLARGFLAAGAEAVVASLWNVHDPSAAHLMEDFYAYLLASSTATPAAALSEAQRRAIARGLHPYFWAPFVAIGW